MIVGCSMFKNEADIARSNIENLLAQGVDHLIVADNLSTDGTTDILREYESQGVLTYVLDEEVGYYQHTKMDRLVLQAGAMGATWILPFDADELMYAHEGTIASALSTAVEDVQWVEGMYHIPHKDDPDDPDPVKRMVHRRAGRDCPQSKVCFRYHRAARLHMGNHNVDYPGSSTSHDDPRRGRGLIAFREFQYRSYEHFVRKVRNGKKAYDASDLPLDCGIHWRQLGALSDEELAEEWNRYLQTPTEFDPFRARSHV